MAAKTNKIEIVINAADKATKVLGGVGKGLAGLGKIAASASVATVAATAAVGVGLAKLAIDAAPLEGIGFAFDKMADRVGLSLDDLREASAGTVSDFELMRKANIALTGAGEQLGVEFGKNLPALMEAARAAAKATGQDVDFLFESLVTGVKRGSPLLIDNTGLVVKLGEANEAMAAKVGKAVADLTAEEKSIALLNATVEAGRRMVDELGSETLTAAEHLAIFRAKAQNTKDQIGLALLPALSALLGTFNKMTGTGPLLVEWAKTVGKWLGEKIPAWIETAMAVFKQFREKLPVWISIARESLGKFISIVMDVGKWIGDKLLIAIEKAREVFAAFVDSIHRGEGALTAFRWALIELGLEDVAIAINRITNSFRELQAVSMESWPAIRDTILNAITPIHSWIMGNWPAIAGVFLTFWEIYKAVWSAVIGVMRDQVWPSLQAIFANLTEALAKLGLDWGDVWGAIGEAIKIVAYVIGAAILGIVGALTAIIATLASVLEHVTSVLADIAATFMTGLEAVANLVGGAMAIIKGIFTGDLELIAAGWAAWKEGLIGLITAFWQGAINIFNLSFGTIINAVVTFVSTFINFFVDLKNELVGGSIVQEMMSAMLEIISAKLTEILGAVTGFITDVVDAFSGLADSLYDIGASIMEGLKDGIMSKVDDILSAIRNIITNLIAEARAALDILSPSGVFAQMGKQMMEGMALGIAGNAGLPAAAAVGAAAGVSRTTNNYFNLTVNSRAATSPVVESFETMRALVG